MAQTVAQVLSAADDSVSLINDIKHLLLLMIIMITMIVVVVIVILIRRLRIIE